MVFIRSLFSLQVLFFGFGWLFFMRQLFKDYEVLMHSGMLYTVYTLYYKVLDRCIASVFSELAGDLVFLILND